MSIASNYAGALSEGIDLKKMLAYMKSRGHLSVLPQVVRILERGKDSTDVGVVTLAKEEDAKKYAQEIADSFRALDVGADYKITIDPRAVGGYSVRAKGMLTDKTFRSALISIYQSATR